MKIQLLLSFETSSEKVCCLPDPKKDTVLVLDGKKVVVPQGNPVSVAEFSTSNFSQSEYLVYKESQACIRYLLKMKF